MLGDKLRDELSAKFSEMLANSPAKDLEKNAKAMLAGTFSKLDLVTREEFDVQAQVLARTREQLAALEARLAALEGNAAPAAPSATDTASGS
ncbi:accessory factor UbiK family protein [Leeia oryzae]|uniref:accessory factor UbiK family protein n=1 Tax=Leeia oryzae TaxID=356662 RepID=UPI000376806A|nr:accessory factor UbiK family protein [Leeia oryzae]